ncbi:hypothetical protein scyTo_0024854, partial [Scyliorhinus torazame]|nr:hypothetical protein [Scyliorhinus torazame]
MMDSIAGTRLCINAECLSPGRQGIASVSNESGFSRSC